MRTFALSAVGIDRPGIIAAVAERLLAHRVNVTDSQMGILRGFFAMTLVVTAPEDVDEAALAGDLRDAGEELGMEAVMLRAVQTAPAGPLAEPTHVVGVHGADHPGILAEVTGALAAASVNVCDLRTRLTEPGVWVMVIQVGVPAAADVAALEVALATAGERQGVTVTLQPCDADPPRA